MDPENQNDTKMESIYPFQEAEQYIALLQENITRMANNSANCKNWLMGIIGGTLAVSFVEKSTEYLPYMLTVLICATVLFFFLDCFYLGEERKMKDAEKEFVQACIASKKKDATNEEKEKPMKLFMTFTNKEDGKKKGWFKKWICKRAEQLLCAIIALDSWSTSPFYLTIISILVALKCAVNHCCCCCCCC